MTKTLSQLAGTAALLIEAEQHSVLTQPSDMTSEAYRSLRDRLKAVRAINPEIRFLYTFRWKAGDEYPRFVLDTGTQGVDFSALGDEYSELTPTLRAAFTAPYRIQVEHDFATDEFGTWISAFAPIIRSDGSLEAVLGLDMDAGRIVQAELRLLLVIASLTGLIVLGMGFISWLFARRIASPLLALTRDMEKIQQFDLEGEPEIDSRISEIQKMEHSLDNMKKGLRSFKKFVSADLVAELIGLEQEAALGTEKRELTVFFCDLENFTNAGEQLSSEELNLLLSTYFATITRTLQEYGATIDKFIGDAVMAFWGAPRPMSDHARQGVLASLELQRRLETLRAEWEAQGLPPLRTRIGLNTGHVLVGNVGYENRLSYTALGDPVNLASRLESLNKYYGTHNLIGEETLRAIDRSISWRPVDKVAVKGKTKGTLIAEIADASPAWWHEYLLGWKAYRGSDWKTALAHFEKVGAVHAADGPSRILADRCRRFLDHGVPADWKGIWVMQDK
jgi:adenylate cyclase